jgi:cobaltochelatase CobN
MCRSRLCWLMLVFFSLLGSASAAPRTLVLLLGDVESRPAVLAVRALQPTLQSLDVSVQIIAANNLTEADRAALGSADVAVVNPLGRQVMQSVMPELQKLQQAGRPIFTVGAARDNALRAIGLREDRSVQAYHRAGGVNNMSNLLRYLLRSQFGADIHVEPVQAMPEVGMYNIHTDRTAASFEQYVNDYARHRPGAPWIGVMFYRASLVSGQTLPLAAIVNRLEQAGYNVLPAFGYPYDVPLAYFLDDAGKPRVDLIVALGMKVGGTGATGKMLEKIGVPAINAITLSRQSAAQWQQSRVGLDIIERSWQMAGAELAGLIQPTVVASRERVTDSATGLAYVEERPIAERIERLTARTGAWLSLRRNANADKRLAILYYNYPHGSETIGAAYLNVLPESLWQITQRLAKEGYRTSGEAGRLPADKAALQTDIQGWGSYPSKDAEKYRQGLATLAASGQALLVPLSDYRRWYAQLPGTLRQAIEKAWGLPENAPVLWRNAQGQQQFVFPARRYGNLLLAPQPGRAWEQNLEKLHNDVSLPPSHEYIAFYLWLQHGYRANAIVHVGTHGTHEWLTGKEAGLSEDDATEALIGAMPNIYPYVMDDVGEGLQAKRRGMATIIDHMTPPFDVAGLNPDLRELGALLNDHRVALQKSPLLARSHLTALNRLAKKSGVLKDMRLNAINSEADLEALEEYLDSTAGKLTPFGLHTFGVAPDEAMRNATARAVVSLDKSLLREQQALRVQQLEQEILQSAALELDRLSQTLSGRYIPAGPSADLVRNPDALPTGRNFFGLDPSRIPSRTTYEQGALLATQLVEDYRKRQGTYPDKITINLWGVETSRHEGIMEAQIMALLGVRPKWDERGRVTGVEAISRSAMGRPRVDVTMISSGLFRDLFGNLLKLLDEAARLAQQQDDTDNPLNIHSRKLAGDLQQRGLSLEEAQRLSAVRIFGLPSGAYGTNVEKLIPLSNAWQNEQQVADVFINRMSHPFGQGHWGSEPDTKTQPEKLRHDLFRQALSGSKIALHSRSSNLFATLDNDDFFQYLGGTALAIRSIDGKTPEVMVSDLSNPRNPRHSTLEKYMGQELQSRYLNPRWADSMLREGYAGTRFINRVVDYLWAWQVTVPEVVDQGKWQRMYDTYVADRHGLRVRERFAESGNLRAFQAMTDRMLTAIERGYWKPSKAVQANLRRLNEQAIREAGIACGSDACSRATLQTAPVFSGLAATAAGVAPGAIPDHVAAITGNSSSVADANAAAASPKNAPSTLVDESRSAADVAPSLKQNEMPQQVSGFEVQALADMTHTQKTIGALVLLLLAVALMGAGYWKHARSLPRDR